MINNTKKGLKGLLYSFTSGKNLNLNREEINKLINRLQEADVSTQRFLKLSSNKAAFEKEFQNKLYSPEEFDKPCGCLSCRGTQAHQAWGIIGKDSLVLVDFDKNEMYNNLSKILPETFEVTSPRRKLPHKYYIVIGGEVPNAVMQLPDDVDVEGKSTGAGEIRAQNEYLVAPGTKTEYGTYTVTKDLPISKVAYSDFMEAVKPYLTTKNRRKLNPEDIINGVGEGKRHETGMQYAGHLIGFKKLDPATALYEMQQWNKLNNPPMTDSDLERMITNAVAYCEEEKEIPTLKELFPEQILPDGKIYKPPFKPWVVAKWMAINRHFKYDMSTDTLYYGDKISHKWTRHGDKKARLLIAKILGINDSQNSCQAIQWSLENLTVVDKIVFSNKIACENGLLDPTTGKLYPFNLNEMTLFSIPTTFDPNAKCPKFIAWLNQVQPSRENQLMLQEWSGYILLNDYRFHKALFCWGEGRNGKTVWAQTIKEVIGGENVSQVPLEDLSGENRFALLALHGKLFNVSSEPSTKNVMQTPNFKRVTGGDEIAGEQKGKDERIHFVNVSKITVLGNHFPRVEDHSLGFKERLLFLKWMVSFVGNAVIPDIQKTWQDEHSGILNWMLEGLQRLLKQQHFTVSSSSIEISKEYTRQSDNIQSFIEEMTTQKKSAKINKTELYNKYLTYCQDYGLNENSAQKFTQRIRELKITDTIQKINGQTQRVWIGITLKHEEVPEETVDVPQETKSIDSDWCNKTSSP